MKTNTRQKIIEHIKNNQRSRAHDLYSYLGISSVAVHKQLKKLIEVGLLTKIGRPPLVYYQLAPEKTTLTIKLNELSKKIIDQINENYLYISPSGELLYGLTGFLQWVKKTNQEKYLKPLINEYSAFLNKINHQYKKKGLIEATDKLKQTFSNDLAINQLFYLDFYSLPKFGKTKIGQLVLYAKQSQNLFLIKELVKLSQNKLDKLIRIKKIGYICFIPHTIPRKVQFLKEYERLIDTRLPKINLAKVYKNNIFVAQKSLSTLQERIVNARETIVIKNGLNDIKNILLIDDAVGSGSTMNETAKKIRILMGKSCKIYGFTLVGSFKGFDVIREI